MRYDGVRTYDVTASKDFMENAESIRVNVGGNSVI